MEDADHGECPVELLACPENHDGELKQEPNTFSATLKSMLDNTDGEGKSGAGLEGKG